MAERNSKGKVTENYLFALLTNLMKYTGIRKYGAIKEVIRRFREMTTRQPGYVVR